MELDRESSLCADDFFVETVRFGVLAAGFEVGDVADSDCDSKFGEGRGWLWTRGIGRLQEGRLFGRHLGLDLLGRRRLVG